MLWQLKETAPPPEGEAGEGKIINRVFILISVKLTLLLKKYKEIVCTFGIYPYICSCYGNFISCRGKNQRSRPTARVRSWGSGMAKGLSTKVFISTITTNGIT